MLLYNTTVIEQSVKAFGNYFTFKPGQIKEVRDELARFIVNDKWYYGIVALPEEFSDSAYKDSDEGKAKLIEYKSQGVAKRIRYLNQLRHNEEVSLRNDLEKAGMATARPEMYANKGILNVYHELKTYQSESDDEQKALVKEIQDAKKGLNDLR